MNEGGPLIHINYAEWLQAFRDITNATNERTLVFGNIPAGGTGHTAPLIHYENAKVAASALVMANMNSLPLDWAVRLSVGGTHLSFFIIKQLPILPPEAFLETSPCGPAYVELIVPRVLELTYTSYELESFARDLGYDGPPFRWNEERRHRLRSELDAIFAHMYGLEREELEWILDAPEPGVSFPTLKRNETKRFGEYRTRRLVLDAFDRMARGDSPDIPPDPK